MESCSFVRAGIGRCGSKFNCKEVEFRHPDYKDLNVRVYVCQIHFMEVFGQSVAVKSSVKPLEVEAWLLVQVRNEESRYRKKLADIKKQVIGLPGRNQRRAGTTTVPQHGGIRTRREIWMRCNGSARTAK